MFFIQKLLEQSMRLENSRKLAIRIVGKLCLLYTSDAADE